MLKVNPADFNLFRKRKIRTIEMLADRWAWIVRKFLYQAADTLAHIPWQVAPTVMYLRLDIHSVSHCH
jgi:hypothetical protein